MREVVQRVTASQRKKGLTLQQARKMREDSL